MPKFVSRGQTFRAVIGDTLVLPCEVEDLGEYLIFFFYFEIIKRRKHDLFPSLYINKRDDIFTLEQREFTLNIFFILFSKK